MTVLKLACVAAASLLLAGCLDPLVDDDVAPPGLILPEGATVPAAHDDPVVEARIAAFDGVEGEIPLLRGFAGGSSVGYWDFGEAPNFAAPLFVMIRKDGAGDVSFVAHNTIIEAIPGDPGYSPYWAVWFVEVTEAYNGERLTSFAAVQEAATLGLVLPPVQQPLAVNCPAVARGVTLDRGDGAAPTPPDTRFYWQGKTVLYYNFGFMPLVDLTNTPEQRMYRLRREGGEPLSEPIRNVDITGDGDIHDTNNVFETTDGDEGWTPLCRTVSVAVPATYVSIDTTMDETIAEYRSASDLFDPGPIPGRVMAFEVTDELRNCPHQVPAGDMQ